MVTGCTPHNQLTRLRYRSQTNGRTPSPQTGIFTEHQNTAQAIHHRDEFHGRKPINITDFHKLHREAVIGIPFLRCDLIPKGRIVVWQTIWSPPVEATRACPDVDRMAAARELTRLNLSSLISAEVARFWPNGNLDDAVGEKAGRRPCSTKSALWLLAFYQPVHCKRLPPAWAGPHAGDDEAPETTDSLASRQGCERWLRWSGTAPEGYR